MSHWHYQIMRHTADSGEDYLAVHEFFVGHDKKQGWTAKPVPIEADTLPEMRGPGRSLTDAPFTSRRARVYLFAQAGRLLPRPAL